MVNMLNIILSIMFTFNENYKRNVYCDACCFNVIMTEGNDLLL